jgi:hypothetical protein
MIGHHHQRSACSGPFTPSVGAHEAARARARWGSLPLAANSRSVGPADDLEARYRPAVGRDNSNRAQSAAGMGIEVDRLVGARGFEPPTSSSRTMRATKLRHAPTEMPAATVAARARRV